QFRCKDAYLVTSNLDTPFTMSMRADKTYQIPMSHGEGRYVISEDELELLKNNDQVAFRYGAEDGEISDKYNPTGAIAKNAGVFNSNHNVLGMMPHPERACEEILGTADGNWIWESIISSME
ncbi:MAG: phosphoribosylformylglycinamidine synthase subunit PurQ, partial [Dehalococcoidia bacterium]|nr:phosphoribosylformylglycinamidine synthase subunit PurQ [Dehalococcoidia bacterium]